MKVQLLTFPGCPNAPAARESLRRVLAEMGLPPDFEEIDTSSPATLPELRGWSSPTILVNGRDAGGLEGPAGAGSCRLYRDESGRSHSPSDALIRGALLKAM